MIASWARRLHHIHPSTVALAALLVVAFALRVYGLNWDQGNYLHPDERAIVMVMGDRIHLSWPPDIHNLLDPAHSGLNPRSDDPKTGQPREFPYGALPLLVTDAAAVTLDHVTGHTWSDYTHLYLVGRPISAFLDTLTVLLVFLIGARVFSRGVGLVSAAVAAFAPMSIQLAHFFTTDSWLTFFVTLCLYCAIRAAERGSPRWFAAAGAAFGFAMATKGSVFTLAPVIAVAGAYVAWRRWRCGVEAPDAILAAMLRVGLAAIASLIAFAIFEPYALVRPGIYIQSLRTQEAIVTGTFDVPFTRQYIGTTRIVYQVEQLVRWGLGPVAGILAFFGLIVLVERVWHRHAAGEILLLTWFVIYGAVITYPETKFLRYLEPLVPVLAITAGLAFRTIWRFVARHANRRVAVGVGTALTIGVALWTAAFTSIYAPENPRLVASQWIVTHIPPGSAISSEYWDDALPYDFGPGLNGTDRQYRQVTFDLYPDYPAKTDLEAIGRALSSQEVTKLAGDATQQGDYATAVYDLGKVAPQLAALPPTARQALAKQLDNAAKTLTPAAGDLGNAARNLAAALTQATGNGPTPDARRLTPVVNVFAQTLGKTGNNEVTNVIYRDLQQSDYVILSSNRLSGSIPRSPWRYPVQIEYSKLLADGQLGFKLVADFHQYPSLGPIQFPDQSADESFTVYDHPRVLIYQKVKLVSRSVYDQLMYTAAHQPVSQTREAPQGTLMLNQPVGQLPVVGDGRWSAALTHHSLAALAVWLVLLGLLQLAGWPLASLVGGRLADGGWGFARLIALLVAGYLVWIGASLRVIEFRAVWCGVSLLLVGGLGWLARQHWRRRGGLWTFRPEQRRLAIGAEAVFWVVFAVFLLFRYLNPDSWHPLWGGEKPMEFAHINAMLRSAHFPPYDPWYAGGYINYYYYGLYLVAWCFKLTGIPSEIAFNLAQPTIIAFMAAGGFVVAATLGRDIVQAGRRRGGEVARSAPAASASAPAPADGASPAASSPLSRLSAFPPWLAGVLGAVLLVGIGNLGGFVNLVNAAGKSSVGDAFSYWVWGPSRAIPYAITEFPFFTGLYADLHAHVVALPITVLAIGLGYALARDPDAARLGLSLRKDASPARAAVLARFLLLMLVVGTLYPTNAWDVPTYGALSVVAIFMATLALRDWPLRIGVTALATAIFAAGAYILFLPFHQHYVALFSSLARVTSPTDFWQVGEHFGGLLAIVCLGLIVALLPRRYPESGPLQQPLLPLLLIAGLLALRLAVGTGNHRLATALTATFVVTVAATLALAAWSRAGGRESGAGRSLTRLALLAVVVIVLLLVVRGELVMGFMLGVAAAGIALWLWSRSVAQRWVGIMVAAAALVGAGVEVFYVVDDLNGGPNERMNTIFKFYNQIWVLLALSGAALIVKMVAEARLPAPAVLAQRLGQPAVLGFAQGASTAKVGARGAEAETEAEARPARLEWSRVGLVIAGLMIAASLVYPITAIGPRLHQRFTTQLGSETLNGLDWMNYGTLPTPYGTIGFKGDLGAIDWLNSHVKGSPVIAEASIGPYRGDGSRIAIATGLPDVIGWAFPHESQQRRAPDLQTRVDDLWQLYNTTDPNAKLAILRRYDVQYVVVGDVERYWPYNNGPYASAAGLAAFNEMVGKSLTVVYQADGTTLYQVNGSQ